MKYPTILLFVVLAWPGARSPAADPERVEFARDVRPILERSCWKCHGPEKQKGGLRLDLRVAAFGSTDSGGRAITPGKADESELIRRVEADDDGERMPPRSDPLSHDETRILRAWVDQGADWPEAATAAANSRVEMVVTRRGSAALVLPAAQPHRSPRDPRSQAWCRTPIDRFILAALEARGIRPNAQANRRTLIRRVYFDLIGLPPSPEEVKAFVEDPAPDAYETLVDRLLASRHYGERWGRHWLDVARYADSDGLESDADRPTAYHYRDFVIRALNDDLPYPTFVRWQIAGDEYEPDNRDALAATGFLAAAPTEVLNVPMEEEKLRLRYNELDDMAVTTVSAFLGLTLGCARCHDHKYDAIPTRDYYRLQCAFTTTRREEVLLATRAEAARYREQRNAMERAVEVGPGSVECTGSPTQKTAACRVHCEMRRSMPWQSTTTDKALLKEQPDSEAGEEARQAAREGACDLGRRLSACLLQRAAAKVGCPQRGDRGRQAVGAAAAPRRPSRSGTGRPRPSRPGCSTAETSMRRRISCRSASSRCSPARGRPRTTGTPHAGRSARIAAPASAGRWRTGSPTWTREPGRSWPA